jgi:hypothetical protein
LQGKELDRILTATQQISGWTNFKATLGNADAKRAKLAAAFVSDIRAKLWGQMT